MKRIASRLQAAQAHLMAAYLAEHGIAANVAGEGTFFGEAGLGVDLWVAEDADVDRALALLADYELRIQEEDESPPADWRCPSCGETLEGVFEACWQCGAERGRG